ncbi:MAG: antitoxin family protein [Candidatus Poribacteria bacterium]|nr:antitoxin family protein [Candidatus Poribacteria bacterium]
MLQTVEAIVENGRIKLLEAVELPEGARCAVVVLSDQKTDEGKASRGWDALRSLVGLGKEQWEGIDPDEYVAELRKGWD